MARTRREFIKTTAAAGAMFGAVGAAATDAAQARHVALAEETDSGAVSIEASTIRKLRIRILPFIFLLFVVAVLDRINIGFAALTMNKELAITSQQYGLIFGIFFFGYFFFEIPSNLLLHKIGARVWIARILISWGIVAMLTGFVHTVHQLYVVRFLLGLAEAGYFPGIVLYLTYWFPQREQARAFALLLAANPVTTILGAPVSGLILDHVHWLGVSSWRWLLILEGTPAIIGGVLTYFLLPSRPQEAKFLTADEKEWIRAELGREEQQKLKQRRYSALQALASGRVWHLVLIYFGMMIGHVYAAILVATAGEITLQLYSNSMVGLLVTIPNLVGLAAMILVSRSSDRTLERRYHVAIPAIVAGTCSRATRDNSVPILFRGAFMFISCGHLQLLRSFLGIAQRVSDGLLRPLPAPL